MPRSLDLSISMNFNEHTATFFDHINITAILSLESVCLQFKNSKRWNKRTMGKPKAIEINLISTFQCFHWIFYNGSPHHEWSNMDLEFHLRVCERCEHDGDSKRFIYPLSIKRNECKKPKIHHSNIRNRVSSQLHRPHSPSCARVCLRRI